MRVYLMESNDTRVITSTFKPPRWLRNRHAQTVYAGMPWAWRSWPELRREELRLPDGDITAVDWLVAGESLPNTTPLLVILHGLEGSAESPYARMLLEAGAVPRDNIGEAGAAVRAVIEEWQRSHRSA